MKESENSIIISKYFNQYPFLRFMLLHDAFRPNTMKPINNISKIGIES